MLSAAARLSRLTASVVIELGSLLNWCKVAALTVALTVRVVSARRDAPPLGAALAPRVPRPLP